MDGRFCFIWEVYVMEMPKIHEQEVLHYLGCRDGDEQVMAQIRAMINTIEKLAVPRILWREFPLQMGQPVGAFTLLGNDVKHLLKESISCIMMGATLGVQIDREIKKRNIRDMGEALVLDACANAGIEAVCDTFCDQLEKDYEKKGQYLTDRFSCGYGDLPITMQSDFIKVLDAQRKIGLYVNESQTLLPCKSVTAIMGVASTIQPTIVRGCGVCKMRKTCVYRKGGTTCGT